MKVRLIDLKEFNQKKFVVLEGLEYKNTFYTMNTKTETEDEKSQDISGKTIYKILGYANSNVEANRIIDKYTGTTLEERVQSSIRKTCEILGIEEIVL